MLPSEFTRTGIYVEHSGVVPSRFQVLGERSSGTNFVKRLLGRNTSLTPSEELGWKHGFPSALAIPLELVVICVVRSADDWARSMHAKPWHATPALQALGFSDFIRSPWLSVVDRAKYFKDSETFIGQPLQADRHPLTGGVFENLFALRQAKLQALMSYLSRDCTCVFLRMEEVQENPQAALKQIFERLALPTSDAAFRPVNKRLGSKFKSAMDDRPKTPDTFSEGDRTFLLNAIDPDQEAALGYCY
ncbi:hypothetical protein GI582_17260 [Sulfitobacter sp. BDSS02]|nr:hypothetical protein [Sulfitobacter sp. BDSS02]MBR9850775.1 hypothetical protein [Paracoccaceae bacterium]